VNGLVFNILGAKIRGRSKLPRGRRIICFSPHPDDDVISMGGLLRKLVENGNDIVVAYMTSGNIAVFDHDVRRYLDFTVRLARERGLDEQAARTLCDQVTGFLDRKEPGDVDTPEVLDIKRAIRESEAISGLETLGLSGANARFLDLPFYRTGRVRKDPIGEQDVAIVRALVEETRPEIIFVAGDLSDPHGTHRMCKEAIDRALELQRIGAGRGVIPTSTSEAGSSLRAQGPALSAPREDSSVAALPRNDWAESRATKRESQPEVWLYRGAWQEWPVTEATWLVPLSQEELRLKIQAIFKHQSQKDSAPFPGLDDREFWQRVEARNTDTAAVLDRLGLAEYFAMEAYVVE
jgi:glucosamine-6-phosphate deaminase